MSDAREAAERLRKYEAAMQTERGHDPYHGTDNSWINDNKLLADAYRRELDPTPVDSQWLESIGFAKDPWHDFKWFFDREAGMPIGLWKVDDGWKAMLLHSDHAASCLVRQQNTRGAVRTLCRALGVELKENT